MKTTVWDIKVATTRNKIYLYYLFIFFCLLLFSLLYTCMDACFRLSFLLFFFKSLYLYIVIIGI